VKHFHIFTFSGHTEDSRESRPDYGLRIYRGGAHITALPQDPQCE